METVRTRIVVSLYRVYNGELVVEQEKEWTPPASCVKSAAMWNVTASIEAALIAFRRQDDVVYVEEDCRGTLQPVGPKDLLLIGSSVESVKFHLIPRICEKARG
jgi:hypothetical protein